MQTFLPYASFEKSAACLDMRRLGKQRVEAWQILLALLGKTGWPSPNHPAVKMWKGHHAVLCVYGRVICDEWIRRGYRDTMRPRFGRWKGPAPVWIGDPAFHAAHRSNLLRKDPAWYAKFNWEEANNLPYVWPV